MIKFTLLFIIFTSSVWAQQKDADRLLLFQTPDPDKITTKKIKSNPDVYLEKESLIQDKNSTTGVFDEAYYTRRDKGRISLSYHTSHDYENFSKLSAIDAQVMMKATSYTDRWWGVQIKRVTAQYNALADELQTSTGHADADANITRGDALQSMTIFGVGAGYRFKILADFFNSNRIFEQVMAYGNYIYHLDGKTSQKYRGFGATMEYGIHRRIGESLFAGVKLSYNLASLERTKKSDEDKIDRSLVFQWTSVGFEVGYYY